MSNYKMVYTKQSKNHRVKRIHILSMNIIFYILHPRNIISDSIYNYRELVKNNNNFNTKIIENKKNTANEKIKTHI